MMSSSTTLAFFFARRLKVTAADWDRYGGNLRAAFFMSQAVARAMVPGGRGAASSTSVLRADLLVCPIAVYCQQGRST
jgi:hypothetical protein